LLQADKSDLSRVTPDRHVTFGNNTSIPVLIHQGLVSRPSKDKTQ
jgi:hypothetical protein